MCVVCCGVSRMCVYWRARDFSVASNTRFYYRVDVECTERKIKYQNGQHRSAPHSKSNRTNENEQPVKPEQRTSIVKTHISESLVKQHSRIHTTDDDDDDGIVWPAVAAVTKYSTHEKKSTPNGLLALRSNIKIVQIDPCVCEHAVHVPWEYQKVIQ